MRNRGRPSRDHARRVARAAAMLSCTVLLGSAAGAQAAGAQAAAPAPNAPARSARVQGRFTMRAVVTRAVNVRGERRSERLRRTWRIRPGRCHRDLCHTLHLRRTRGRGRVNRLTLYRRRDGTYVGHGSFFAGLSCDGRIYPRGSRARYTIRLRVTATRTLGEIRFARRIAATYENPSRTDSTPCLLPASHDAARYRGRLLGGAPSPPRASFSARIRVGGAVAFRDMTRKGFGPGRRVVRWRWSFGDPGSGSADHSARRNPDHRFSRPGRYRVRLVTTDAAGLRASVVRSVVIHGSRDSMTASRAPRRDR